MAVEGAVLVGVGGLDVAGGVGLGEALRDPRSGDGALVPSEAKMVKLALLSI